MILTTILTVFLEDIDPDHASFWKCQRAPSWHLTCLYIQKNQLLTSPLHYASSTTATAACVLVRRTFNVDRGDLDVCSYAPPLAWWELSFAHLLSNVRMSSPCCTITIPPRCNWMKWASYRIHRLEPFTNNCSRYLRRMPTVPIMRREDRSTKIT